MIFCIKIRSFANLCKGLELMKDKRILYVSSEVVPYLPETEIASTAFNVAKRAHSKGVQTRIFMPRFGVINERRHQLHEVIRLSGMNLIINDMDMPLIIKVASIPKERMQVYFIDNDEYFKRKAIFSDEDDQLFSDNDERAIFFAKGEAKILSLVVDELGTSTVFSSTLAGVSSITSADVVGSGFSEGVSASF